MTTTRFIQMAVILTLMVTAVSCGMQREMTGDDYYTQEERSSNRYHRNNTAGTRTIIVERDPYTGRYYEVSPYSGFMTLSPFDNPFYYNDRRYYNNNRTYYPRTYGQSNSSQPKQNSAEQQRTRESNETIRKNIMGKQ